MKLTIRFICFLGLVIACQSVAQDYFPLSVGNTWIFHSRDGSQERLIKIVSQEEGLEINRNGRKQNRKIQAKLDSDTVVVYDQVNSRAHFLIRTPKGLNQSYMVQYKKRKNGKIKSTVYTYELEQLFLPQLVRPEKKWNTSGHRLGGKKAKAETLDTRFKVVSTETLKVKSGLFHRVMRISEESDHLRKARKKTLLNYIWLAPNIGPIRYKTINGEIFELTEHRLALGVETKDYHLPTTWGRLKFQSTRLRN